MATDVVLVAPPLLRRPGRYEQLGLAYLAAALRRVGVGTEILDAGLMPAGVRRVVDLVSRAQPRVVGITATQPQGSAVVATAKGVRTRLPEAHITAGGHFPTFCHDRLLRDVPALDSVVRGEGDLVFVDLVKRVLAGEEWRGLPGVSFRQDGAVVSTPPGRLVTNLDRLPFPARDTAQVVLGSGGSLSVSSSRGCYGRCTFCSISAFYGLQRGPAWRPRSAENIVEEIAVLARDYGCKLLAFADDNFIGPGTRGRERAHAIAHAMVRSGLRIEFSLMCRPNDVERDLFGHLREAGLGTVKMGIESGNQRQLDRFRKGTTVEDGRRAISILHDLGIKVGISLVMFDPDSTFGECFDTLRFVADEGVLRDARSLGNLATPHDGTELCEQLRGQGRLRGGYLRGYSYSWRDPLLGLCARAASFLQRIRRATMQATNGWGRGLSRDAGREQERSSGHTQSARY